MSSFCTFLTFVHSAAGPTMMLLYPLYASVLAIEARSRRGDKPWLAYWILYSFLTLVEIILQPILEWIPIWYDLKLAFIAWLVLPPFRGSAFIYDKFVREKVIKRYGVISQHVQSNIDKMNNTKKSSPEGKNKGKSKGTDETNKAPKASPKASPEGKNKGKSKGNDEMKAAKKAAQKASPAGENKGKIKGSDEKAAQKASSAGKNKGKSKGSDEMKAAKKAAQKASPAGKNKVKSKE